MRKLENRKKYCQTFNPLTMENQANLEFNEPLQNYTPSVSNTQSSENTMKILSLIASGMVALGFVLPWIKMPNLGGLEGSSPSINGLSIISQNHKLFSGIDLPMIFIVVLLCIPTFSIIFFVTRLNRGYENKRIGTIAVSFLSFIPVFLLMTGIFMSSAVNQTGIRLFLNKDEGLGIGMIFMMLGSVFLIIDTIIQLNKIKTGSLTSKYAWGKGAMLGGGIGISFLLLWEIFKNGNGQNAEFYMFLLFAIFVTGIFLAINFHKRQDLNSKITFERGVGTGIITSGMAGIATYLIIFMSVPQLQNSLPNSAVIGLTFIFVQLGFMVSSIIAFVMENITYNQAVYVDNSNPIVYTNSNEGNPENQIIPIQQISEQVQPFVNQRQYFTTIIKEPSIPLSERLSVLTTWFKVHAKIILLSGSSLGSLLAVYILFIKPNPEKEGEKAAKEKCECWDTDRTELIGNLDKIINLINSGTYKRKAEVRTELEKVNKISDAYIKCENAVSSNRRSKFTDDYDKISRFNATYDANVCQNSKDQIVSTKLTEIEQKILLIKDPEPDVDKIKTDLIGNQIPGWTFDLLSDFKEFKISNVVKASDRIEYQIDMKLVGKNSDPDHDCQIIAIYSQNENGWNFNSVKMQYITFINTFYPDKLTMIKPFINCNWTSDNHYKLGWKTINWEYAPQFTTGPDLGQTSLPNSDVYYIWSLENKEVKVKFTYKPNY